MRPRNFCTDIPGVGFGDSKLGCYFFKHRSGIQSYPPDFNDVFCGESCAPMKLSRTQRSLFRRVSNIVQWSSNPKMCRINTPSIVSTGTVVKNVWFFFWDWTKVNNPTCPVGGNHSFSARPHSDRSVAIPCGSVPQPTRLGNCDLGKEPRNKCFGKSLLIQIFRCKSELLSIAHNILGHASGCLLGTAEAFLLCILISCWSSVS